VAQLSINFLGELELEQDGQFLELPPSKKTRALLAYLVLTGRPHRRDRLCEMFWEVPDDPRGSLRWSLSKLRRVINDDKAERLVADRERVAFADIAVNVDLFEARSQLGQSGLSRQALLAMSRELAEPLLDGLDLPDHELFQNWLVAERNELAALRAENARRLSLDSQTSPLELLEHCRVWLDNDPFNPQAATALVTALRQVGKDQEAQTLGAELTGRFGKAGIAWNANDLPQPGDKVTNPPTERQILSLQRIQFCTASDGVHIAYATVGEGPPLVKAANWLSHLEHDWEAPIWSPLFRELARDHNFIRYDERGNGLSDWDVDEISFEVFVTDLETVIDTLGLERFPLLGISQGAAVSIEYAVRHPERVSHLVLFGAYPAGWRIDASEKLIREREAVMTLTESGWGQDNPAYRQIFSSTFMPSATTEELSWFNNFQRQTTSPKNAVRFLSAFGDIDVRSRLAEVTVPTLVMHSTGDQRIPFTTGRKIATEIRNAEFISLDTDNHLLLGREPASQVFVESVRRFISS
jgi:pimeloyl-ACP methyl ester carboxylesterase/DNA-binding SARP family transcriptional activator